MRRFNFRAGRHLYGGGAAFERLGSGTLPVMSDSSSVWGTVPEWFGGGSLILAFYILLRDRRKDETKYAARLVCWSTLAGATTLSEMVRNPEADRDDGHRKLFVQVINKADVPFYRLMLMARPLTRLERRKHAPKWALKWHTRRKHGKCSFPSMQWKCYYFTRGLVDVLDPDSQLGVDIQLDSFALDWKVFVHFGDANGQFWLKDLRSGKSKRAPRLSVDLVHGNRLMSQLRMRRY